MDKARRANCIDVSSQVLSCKGPHVHALNYFLVPKVGLRIFLPHLLDYVLVPQVEYYLFVPKLDYRLVGKFDYCTVPACPTKFDYTVCLSQSWIILLPPSTK